MRRGVGILAALLIAALALAACTAADEPGDTLPDDAPVVAFYGDSYTAGTGASDPSLRWSTRIAAERGWREVNPSVNGLGFVTNRDAQRGDLVTQIIDVEPDVVIVTMGLNDVFSFDAASAAIERQISRDLTRLREELPDARLVVVEPFWYTAERPEALETIIGWVERAAADVGADHIGGASRWIQGRAGEMAADGLHPNDAGYDLITTRMDAALGDLGL